MSRRITILLVLISLWFFPKPTRCLPEQTFAEVWAHVQQHAPALAASSFEWQAAKIAHRRSATHWLPEASFGGQIYETNDPALHFFSILGQRSVTQMDFDPAQLNEPPSEFFQRGQLLLDWPLFEGGGKHAQAKALRFLARAKSYELSDVELKHYIQTARLYGHLLILDRSATSLTSLAQFVASILSSYQLHSKANPLGYSGYLGLKNLQNRIASLQTHNAAITQGARVSLQELAHDLPEDWQIARGESAKIRTFVSTYLNGSSGIPTEVLSSRTQAFSSRFSAAQARAQGEWARFMPRVGFFTEGHLVSGERDFETAYNLGGYAQWQIFSAPNIGAVRQARLEAQAAQAMVVHAQLEDRTRSFMALANLKALDENLNRLDESSALLDEQIQTTRRLFAKGAINVLQLVEVLSRRVDLVHDLQVTEEMHLQTAAELFDHVGKPLNARYADAR